MFLNETKPPLDEALLMHYGVKGMRWGQRRANRKAAKQAQKEADEFEYNLFGDEPHNRRKQKIATGLLVAAGAAATVTVLHKSGHLKVAAKQARKFKKYSPGVDSPVEVASNARRTAEDAYEAYRTMRPKKGKKPSRFNATQVAAGLSETLIRDGVYKIHTMDKSVWETPMSDLGGRR